MTNRSIPAFGDKGVASGFAFGYDPTSRFVVFKKKIEFLKL
jgi:hypothetical protein